MSTEGAWRKPAAGSRTPGGGEPAGSRPGPAAASRRSAAASFLLQVPLVVDQAGPVLRLWLWVGGPQVDIKQKPFLPAVLQSLATPRS